MLRLRQSIAHQQAAAQQTAAAAQQTAAEPQTSAQQTAAAPQTSAQQAAPRWVSRSESPTEQQWIEQQRIAASLTQLTSAVDSAAASCSITDAALEQMAAQQLKAAQQMAALKHIAASEQMAPLQLKVAQHRAPEHQTPLQLKAPIPQKQVTSPQAAAARQPALHEPSAQLASAQQTGQLLKTASPQMTMASQQAASLQSTADCSRPLTHNEEIDFCIQQAVMREDYHTAAVLAAIDPQRKAVTHGSAAGVRPHGSAAGVRPHGSAAGVRPHGSAEGADASHEQLAQEKLQAASSKVRMNPLFFYRLFDKVSTSTTIELQISSDVPILRITGFMSCRRLRRISEGLSQASRRPNP